MQVLDKNGIRSATGDEETNIKSFSDSQKLISYAKSQGWI